MSVSVSVLISTVSLVVFVNGEWASVPKLVSWLISVRMAIHLHLS